MNRNLVILLILILITIVSYFAIVRVSSYSSALSTLKNHGNVTITPNDLYYQISDSVSEKELKALATLSKQYTIIID